MDKPEVIAVLDVGKTNKKLALYDVALNPVDFRKIALNPTPTGDGLEYEKTGELFDWTCRSLAEYSRQYQIRGFGVTTHGATFAAVDEQGDLVHPVFSYLSPAGSMVEEEFYREFGTPEEIHVETCTPPFGFANVAKQIFYLQKMFPEDWERAAHILYFPQYIGYLLTGNIAADPTYLGCHTYLWNLSENRPSEIAKILGIDRMMPSRISAPWEKLGKISTRVSGRFGIEGEIPVMVGIHDSNASLLPYLAKDVGQFTLVSTGTWCVAMTPSANFDFASDELGTKTFYILSAFNRPVKAAIFPGGLEFSEFADIAGATEVKDQLVLRQVCIERELFLTGGLVEDAKAFSHSEPGLYVGDKFVEFKTLKEQGPEEYGVTADQLLSALILSIAIQTVELLNHTGRADGGVIFVEGGFSENDLYCGLLAALVPGNKVKLSEMREATSFGTALCVWKMVEEVELGEIASRFELKTKSVEAIEVDGLEDYREAYLKLVTADSCNSP
ncbi:MAG: FGGY family carbohydrate kinase [Verrucomicrobiota bacterium]